MSLSWGSTKTRHGTNSGWMLHQRLGERPCPSCYNAKQTYDKQRLRIPENTRKNRDTARAQGRARSELARRYPEEYRELYEKAKKEIEEEQ